MLVAICTFATRLYEILPKTPMRLAFRRRTETDCGVKRTSGLLGVVIHVCHDVCVRAVLRSRPF